MPERALTCQPYIGWEGTIIAVTLPNGSIVSIASGYGSVKTVTAITNANPGTASSTAHALTVGTYVEVTSGWSRLNSKIVRVINPLANAFDLEGVDTTLTAIYPAGSGVGSVRAVSGFTQLAQILTSNTSGGDQQFLTYQFLEADAQRQIPTFKNPQTVKFTVADDATLAGFQLAGVANDDRLPRAVKIVLASGAIILYNAYVSLNRSPSLTINQLMECEVTLSLLNEPVRYIS